MGLSLSLPRASSLTDELLGPVPAVDGTELLALRQRLLAAMAPLSAELPPGNRLVLDAFRFRRVLRRPETLAAGDEPFRHSPSACRRAVGLTAVERCVRRRAAGPSQAVAQVLAEGAEDAASGAADGAADGQPGRPPWWASWYAGLPAGARAVVAAEATTWATQLWTSLEWRRLPAPVVVGGHDDWWDLPGRRISLKGRADLRLRLDGRSLLVVVGGGAPDGASRSELMFAALVCALVGAARSAPGRVVGLWPAAGQVRMLPVEAHVLEAAADEAVSVAATWIDALLDRHQRQSP